MRLPRVRFTIRWMMLAVAIVGVSIPVVIGWAYEGEAREYHRRARLQGKLEANSRLGAARFRANIAALKEELAIEYVDSPDMRERRRLMMESCRELTAMNESYARACDARERYHASLKFKYARAARYPWLPVEPDPPEPK